MAKLVAVDEIANKIIGIIADHLCGIRLLSDSNTQVRQDGETLGEKVEFQVGAYVHSEHDSVSQTSRV
jgi:hypothetical protein